MWNWLPQVAGTIAGPVSDYFQGQENRKAHSESDRLNRERADAELGMNLAKQEEFAKNSIRWKIADGAAAGLSPLAALGASGTSFSPVSSNYQSTPYQNDTLSRMGQSISRATQAASTSYERELHDLQVSSLKLDIEGKAIDNQIRASQLSQRSQIGPSFPGADNFIPGQGNSGSSVRPKPATPTMSQEGRLSQEAGWVPTTLMGRTDTGFLPYMPQQLAESTEDDPLAKIDWFVRNRLVPMFTGSGKPPKSQLPKGATDWDLSNSGEWVPVSRSGSNPWERWSNYITNWQDRHHDDYYKWRKGFNKFNRR